MGDNWLTKAAAALPRGYFDGIGAALDVLKGEFAEAAQKNDAGTIAAFAEVVRSQLSPKMGFHNVEIIEGGDHLVVVNPDIGDAAVVRAAKDGVVIEEIQYEDVGETAGELLKAAQWGDRPLALPNGDLDPERRDRVRRKKPKPETFDSQWQEALKALDVFLTDKCKTRYLSAEELLWDSEGAIYLSDGGYSRILARFEGWKGDEPDIGISDVSRPQVKARWHSSEIKPLKKRLIELMRQFLKEAERKM